MLPQRSGKRPYRARGLLFLIIFDDYITKSYSRPEVCKKVPNICFFHFGPFSMAISMKHVKYILLGTFGNMGIAFSYGYTMEKDPKTLMPRYVCVWVPGRIEFGRPRCQDESRFEGLSKQPLQPCVYSQISPILAILWGEGLSEWKTTIFQQFSRFRPIFRM